MASFRINETEAKSVFDVSEIKAAEAKNEANAIRLTAADFLQFDTTFAALIEAYKFTGFNPADYKNYLETKVFVKPAYTETTASMVIGMLLALFISRGNKISKKNEKRMDAKGQAAIKVLEDRLGNLFMKTYNPEDLVDTSITAARVAACYPVDCARLMQKYQTRSVGNAPPGVPRGYTNSLCFSILPHSCKNLLKGMSLWRDNFALVINPKAKSPEAQNLARASAYNFSKLAYDSTFIDEETRGTTVATIASMAWTQASKSFEKYMMLLWVDHAKFIDTLPGTRDATQADVQLLSAHPFRAEYLNSLNLVQIAKLANAVTALAVSQADIANAETWLNMLAIQDILAPEVLESVGNFGGRDQGKSFENAVVKQTRSQPGFSYAREGFQSPSSFQMPTMPFNQSTQGVTFAQAPATLPPMPSQGFLQGLMTSSPVTRQ